LPNDRAKIIEGEPAFFGGEGALNPRYTCWS